MLKEMNTNTAEYVYLQMNKTDAITYTMWDLHVVSSSPNYVFTRTINERTIPCFKPIIDIRNRTMLWLNSVLNKYLIF